LRCERFERFVRRGVTEPLGKQPLESLFLGGYEGALHFCTKLLQKVATESLLDGAEELLFLFFDVAFDEFLECCQLRRKRLMVRSRTQKSLELDLGNGVLLEALGDEVWVDLPHRGIKNVLLDSHVGGQFIRELDQERPGLVSAALELIKNRLHLAMLLFEESSRFHESWYQAIPAPTDGIGYSSSQIQAMASVIARVYRARAITHSATRQRSPQ